MHAGQSHLNLTLKCHQNLTGGVVGTKSSYAHQQILFREDTLGNCIKKDDGTFQQLYFLAGK